MRLEGKTVIIIGAGQTPGATMGVGRASAYDTRKKALRLGC